MLLENQIALITGAGRGWGRSIAMKLALHGATVVAVSRTKTELDEAVELIKNENGKAEGIIADISDDGALQSIIQRIDNTYGKLNILINNAAILPLKNFVDFTFTEIDKIISINLRAPIVLTKLAFGLLKQGDGGSIINVSSSSGVLVFPQETIYCACKHGLEGFTKSIALEYKQYNIAVNTITPGGGNSGVRIKPTSLTQLDFNNLSEVEKEKYTDSIISTDAFVFLALQRAKEITGKRFLAYELSEHIRTKGWHLAESDLFLDPAADGFY